MGSGCDSDWDFPLTDEDLQAIDDALTAAGSSFHPETDSLPVGCIDNSASSQFPPQNRRRLPDSLFDFTETQKRRSFSLTPCSRNYGARKYYHSSFQEIKFGGHIIYSRTTEEVERAANEILNFVEAKRRKDGECTLGLDIEWKPSFGGGVAPGKAAVMQICGDRNICHVLHIIHSQIPKPLQCLLQDTASLKVGVCIANDASKVLQDYMVPINSLADLSDLANQKLGGETKKRSLANLTEMLICRKISRVMLEIYFPSLRASVGSMLPKPSHIRLGNWEVDVLSKDQLSYAATDAYVSWCLYQVLNNFPDPVDEKCEKRCGTTLQ